MISACLSREELRELLEGRLPALREHTSSLHLQQCDVCRGTAENLSGDSRWAKKLYPSSKEPSADRSAALNRLMRSLIGDEPSSNAEVEHPFEEILRRLAPSSEPGSMGRFDTYEVEQLIDAGGMGIVLKARDPQLNRVVALKLLAPVLAASQQARHRFLREARSVAAIEHENVVAIHSAFEAQGLPCLVMEFVVGESLAKRLKREGSLDVDEIARIGCQVAAGLSAAHAQNIIHRDIKPANILIESETGRVKITDFGLARAVDDSSLTRSGFVAGTPDYLSPEQAAGAAVDQRADLFSLGCVLYALCTGQSPFRADSTLATLRNVCDLHPPPVEEINPTIPRWFSEIIVKLLAKQPNQRFDSAKDVIAAIERADAVTEEVRPARTRGIFVATAGIAVMLIALAIITQRVSRSPAVVDRSSARDSLRSSPASVENERASLPTPSFVVRDKFGAFAGEFQDISQAVQAAPPNATIECQFTGDLPIEAVDLGDKPLIVRAAADSKPAFVITRRPAPLLRTRAPLVLEGLTFKVPALESRPSQSPYHSPFNEPVIESSNAPLLMANCRIEMVEPLGGPLGGGCCVGLIDNSFAAFENCEFYSPKNGAIGHFRSARSLPNAPGPDRIIIRNCVQTGFALVHTKESRGIEMLIELTRNTTAIGSCTVGFTEPPANTPVTVAATQNVFDVEHVVGSQPQARLLPAERLLRWIDATNWINVKQGFTRTRPALTTAAEWQRFIGSQDAGWIPVELSLVYRIMELRTDLNQFTPERFLLSAIEKEQLERIVPGLSHALGVQPEICGPGEGYDRWKQSSAYADWQKEIDRLVFGQK